MRFLDELKSNSPSLLSVSFDSLNADEHVKLIDALQGNTHLQSLSVRCSYRCLDKEAARFGRVINAIPSLHTLHLWGALLGSHIHLLLMQLQHNATGP